MTRHTKCHGPSHMTAQNILSVMAINEIQDFTILALILNFMSSRIKQISNYHRKLDYKTAST